MNYEQILQAAKDEVARKNGWKDWDELFRNVYPRERINLLNEAALLAMQRVAEAEYLRGHNEAANQSRAPF